MENVDLIKAFHGVATASVADAIDQITGKRGYMDQSIKPRINEKKVVGPAVTILEGPTTEKLPPQLALDAIDTSPEGSVFVISVAGELNVAVWGGLMTAGAVANGHAGAILDGGVRDITEIRRDYGFPVYARSITPGTTVGRYETLAANVPVVCGDIEVHPGDIIVADIDGVVVVPLAHAEAVLKLAQDIDDRELKQARLIIDEKSFKKGIEKYGRI
ncbi:RraA family protein [Pararobbsia silviterrae]|uniref:Putative 4-hydroxy-4-methyl-2-oxoglutarate aldolase n=1 Tax=Pararobbsia silviterrae TaxID=1792498 RepID=A0A494XML9_9BURK|nr:RraA family protein [Pararobbsia silviterrae]RKP51868.1 RraA family protein [Pararobbsia silviterrae]